MAHGLPNPCGTNAEVSLGNLRFLLQDASPVPPCPELLETRAPGPPASWHQAKFGQLEAVEGGRSWRRREAGGLLLWSHFGQPRASAEHPWTFEQKSEAGW